MRRRAVRAPLSVDAEELAPPAPDHRLRHVEIYRRGAHLDNAPRADLPAAFEGVRWGIGGRDGAAHEATALLDRARAFWARRCALNLSSRQGRQRTGIVARSALIANRAPQSTQGLGVARAAWTRALLRRVHTSPWALVLQVAEQ
jgi:hypothetical protein